MDADSMKPATVGTMAGFGERSGLVEVAPDPSHARRALAADAGTLHERESPGAHRLNVRAYDMGNGAKLATRPACDPPSVAGWKFVVGLPYGGSHDGYLTGTY